VGLGEQEKEMSSEVDKMLVVHDLVKESSYRYQRREKKLLAKKRRMRFSGGGLRTDMKMAQLKRYESMK